MKKERWEVLKTLMATGLSESEAGSWLREVYLEIEALMVENADLKATNAALRNFAQPVQTSNKEEAFYRMADELGWKFKDVTAAK